MGFLSSYNRELREHPVLPQGSLVSIRFENRSTGLLSSHGRGIRPQFVMKGESRGLYRVAAGNFGVPRVATVTSGNFSWCLLEFRNPFMLWWASWDSSDVSTMEEGLISCSAGKSGFLSCSDVDLGVCLVSNGKSGLNCVEAWNSALLSRCKGGFRSPVELNWGLGLFSNLESGYQSSLHVVS